MSTITFWDLLFIFNIFSLDRNGPRLRLLQLCDLMLRSLCPILNAKQFQCLQSCRYLCGRLLLPFVL